jgi:hypothetical protein
MQKKQWHSIDVINKALFHLKLLNSFLLILKCELIKFSLSFIIYINKNLKLILVWNFEFQNFKIVNSKGHNIWVLLLIILFKL